MGRLRLVAAVGLAAGVLIASGCALEGEERGPPQDIVSSIPWALGEEASYSILDRDGERLGTGLLRIEGEDGRLRLVQQYQNPEFDDRTVLVVEGGTLKPVSGERSIRGEEGELRIEARYAGRMVEIERTAREDGEEEQRTDRLEVPAHAYDSASSLFLWRTIPLRENYQATYVNLATAIVEKPQRNRVSVRVAGRETVEVPAGAFETWRLEIRSAGVEQTAWYGTGGSHPLVKYDRGDMVFLLEAIREGEAQGSRLFPQAADALLMSMGFIGCQAADVASILSPGLG